MGADGFRELGAERAADAGAEAALPFVETLDGGEIAGGFNGASAKPVRVFDLLEKLEWVVDAVDAEIEGIDIPGAEHNGGLRTCEAKVCCDMREK